MRTQNEGLAEAPTFTPHRVAVTAADPAPTANVPPKSHGLDSKGYEDVVAQVRFENTVVAFTGEVYFWSDEASKMLPQVPAVTFTGSADFTFRFTSDGRRFWLKVNTLTGTSPVVHIDVAGAAPGVLEERA